MINCASEPRQLDSPAPGELVLLGTDHRDPRGFERSTSILARLRPDMIFVELSPYGLEVRRKHGSTYRKVLRVNTELAARACRIPVEEALKHPEIEAIGKQFDIPFEFRAASAYAQQTPVRIFLVDISDFSRRLAASWPELITVENLSMLLVCPAFPPAVHQAYRRALDAIHREDVSPHQTCAAPNACGEAEEFWTRREHSMARRIAGIARFHSPERPVYVGGWWHLTRDDRLPTLRTILGVDASRCRLIDSPA